MEFEKIPVYELDSNKKYLLRINRILSMNDEHRIMHHLRDMGIYNIVGILDKNCELIEFSDTEE